MENEITTEYPGAQDWPDHRDRIVRVWIKRSKDLTRPRAERDYAWQKALKLAADAPGYIVFERDNGRLELNRVVRSWPAPDRQVKHRFYHGGRMVEVVRIYRTRPNGKSRTQRVGGSFSFSYNGEVITHKL